MASPLGSAPSVILGVGLGAAASTAIEPLIEPARQKAWENNPNRINPAALYAALVAQGAIDLSEGSGYALRDGLAGDKFRQLVYMAQRAPTYAEAQDLKRRNKINLDQLYHSFAKAQIEHQYWEALADLVDDRLSPQNVAVAIVRGLMVNPDILPVGPPTEQGKIPAFPVSSIDPVTESEASGFNKERLAVLAGIFGRPPGPELAARATFREIIEKVDYDRAISEGDVRNEWADAIFEATRAILSPNQYAELDLRGYINADTRRRLTAQHGMSTENSDLLYDLLGRSIPVHQITTGFARGGTFEGPVDTIPKAYLQSLQRGNLRPEYYNLAYANRYSLPSAFVIRALLTDGAITQAQGETLFLESGWPPELAKLVAEAYAPTGTTTKVDPFVKRAQTQLWTATHKAYLADTLNDATADTILTNLIPGAGDRAEVLQLWLTEKNLAAQPRAGG